MVVNDRWGIGTRNKHGGYYTGGDRYNPGQKIGHKWENCMTIDMDSWGFRRNADITVRALLPEFGCAACRVRDGVSLSLFAYTCVSALPDSR